VLFLSCACVCVCVGGVVLCRCVCVCDLLIFSHLGAGGGAGQDDDSVPVHRREGHVRGLLQEGPLQAAAARKVGLHRRREVDDLKAQGAHTWRFISVFISL